MLSLLHYLKFYRRILDSFKFQKLQTRYVKVMAKDKKVNIEVSYSPRTNIPAYLLGAENKKFNNL